MKPYLYLVTALLLVTVGCSAPTTPAAPTTATLSVVVNADAFVTVILPTTRVGQIAVNGSARFPDLPIGQTVTVRASNRAGEVEATVLIAGDQTVTLTVPTP